jgi:hypothetical protein
VCALRRRARRCLESKPQDGTPTAKPSGPGRRNQRTIVTRGRATSRLIPKVAGSPAVEQAPTHQDASASPSPAPPPLGCRVGAGSAPLPGVPPARAAAVQRSGRLRVRDAVLPAPAGPLQLPRGRGGRCRQRYLVGRGGGWAGPGGPIFFYCGNEGDIAWFAANSGLVWEAAPRFAALVVFAEAIHLLNLV